MAFFVHLSNELDSLVNLARQSTSTIDTLDIQAPNGEAAVYSELANYDAIQTNLSLESGYLNDAKNAHQVLSDASQGISSITQNLAYLREITVFGENTALTVEQRTTWGAILHETLDEILQTSNQYTYDDVKLLDGSYTEQSFTYGEKTTNTLEINLSDITPNGLGIHDINIDNFENSRLATIAIDEALNQIASASTTVSQQKTQLDSHLASRHISFVNLTDDEIVNLNLNIVSDGKTFSNRRSISSDVITTYLYSQNILLKTLRPTNKDSQLSIKI